MTFTGTSITGNMVTDLPISLDHDVANGVYKVAVLEYSVASSGTYTMTAVNSNSETYVLTQTLDVLCDASSTTLTKDPSSSFPDD
jgi:hypothetical protein